MRPRFHLAFPVRDISEARAFYGDLLGCPEGRSSEEWVDFDFFGHQIVAHLSPNEITHKAHNRVDGENVPVRHFGVILSFAAWQTLADKLSAAGVSFIIKPGLRFKGETGEQATFFLTDLIGNALAFKALLVSQFRNSLHPISALFEFRNRRDTSQTIDASVVLVSKFAKNTDIGDSANFETTTLDETRIFAR